MAEEFRPMDDRVRAIVDRLLELPFPGRDEVQTQLEGALVRFAPGCEQHCGSLEFEIRTPIRIPTGTPSPLPVEGRLSDEDGAPVDVLLFHRDGALSLLEFVVYSDHIKIIPTATQMNVWGRTSPEKEKPHQPDEGH